MTKQASQVIKVMNFNIRDGWGPEEFNKAGIEGQKENLKLIAEVIATIDPDFIGLNEVDCLCERSGLVDMTQIIGDYLQMNRHFSKAVPRKGAGEVDGNYGNAILSKRQLLLVEQFMLPLPTHVEYSEPRTATIVRSTGNNPVYFAHTHLAHEDGAEFDQLRADSIREITRRVQEGNYYPCVLAGDMNFTPDSPGAAEMRKNWTVVNDNDPKPTYPAHNPRVEIDYIAFAPKGAFDVLEYDVLPEEDASDHRPVYAKLQEKSS